MQRVEHLLDPVVIGIDKCIIKDHRRRAPALRRTADDRESRQRGQLFTHAAAETLGVLLLTFANYLVRQERLSKRHQRAD